MDSYVQPNCALNGHFFGCGLFRGRKLLGHAGKSLDAAVAKIRYAGHQAVKRSRPLGMVRVGTQFSYRYAVGLCDSGEC